MSVRITGLKTVAVLLVMLCLSAGVATAEQPKESKEILILHSYHPGFPWTDEMMKGLQDVFSNYKETIHFHVEYLDTKRQPDPEYFTHVLDAILHYKLKDRFFDLVIVSDDEALNFVIEHKDNLFPSTPIVFSGVEEDILELHSGEAIITGVVEKPDYNDLLKTIITLQPDTREVVIIGSHRDLTGRLETEMIKQAAARYSDRMKITLWNDIPADDLALKLQKLGPGQVLFINGPVTDRDGKLLSFPAKNKLVTNNCSVPLYSPWDLCLGHGIIGGQLGSPRQQGHLAATLALDIFAGNPPANGSVVTPLKSERTFDYNQLKKFNIPVSRLPKDSKMINTPMQLNKLAPTIIWSIIGLFAIALAIILLLINNILKKRRAERQLRDSEQQYKYLNQQFQVILDGLPDGLTLISREMEVIWSNKGDGAGSFNNNLGHVPVEYCCNMLYNRADICEKCPAILAFESGCDEESIITTPDNRLLEVKAFPIHDESGKVANVITLATDITEKIRLSEDAMRNNRLASLGELAAGVAHEINNPNALILLNADLVQKSCAAAAPILQSHFQRSGDFSFGALNYSEMRHELPHLFKEMQQSANRIKSIVNDLKDFARNDSADLDESVDLNEVAQAAIRLVGNTIKNSTHSFRAYYCSDMPFFRGNFQRIEQVVINLVMNACQALPNKDAGVQLSTHYDSDKNINYLLVRDEGTGIKADILPYISDPFFTTKREQGGTGLGLSVTSRIVQDHGGTLDFNSQHEGGTTVTLSFPALLQGAT